MPKLNIDIRTLDAYAKAIKDDYALWQRRTNSKSDISEEMIAEFGVDYEVGNTYIRFWTTRNGRHGSVHSFVVNKPTKGFQIGDVLKAAGWKAPATNFVRGRVDFLDARITNWTGAQ